MKLSYDEKIKLYELLKLIDKLFEENDIKYWADGGTLLGSLREGHIIEHDDDADIAIHFKDLEKLKKIEFNKYGMELIRFWGGWKLFYADSLILKDQGDGKNCDDLFDTVYKVPACDIFTYAENPYAIDKTILYPTNRLIRDVHYPNCYFKKDEIKEIKKVKFGPIEINIPNDPHPYLTRYLGNDYMTTKRDKKGNTM
jgi:phosphorylcholine metabolism protein LicD